MSEQLEKMQNLYESLANQLSEATVHPESLSQFFDCISNWKINLEKNTNRTTNLIAILKVTKGIDPEQFRPVHQAGCGDEQLVAAFKDPRKK